jgi:methylaspartate mutase epsilon subunit
MTMTQLDWNALNDEREHVLKAWPTGKQVDLGEAVAYHRAMPPGRVFARALEQAQAHKQLLLQPRAGVPLIDEHRKLLQYLEKEGAADVLPTTIDAYTRQNRYKEAARGIELSLAERHALLNGFPAVNHGVDGCRKIVECVSRPVQVRHGTPDARLLAEITLAAGFTSFEGGGISYNIPYAKDVPLEKSIRDWQYVDRLVGWYGEQGITINREPFGPLTGTLVPPCIGNAIGIIEGLLALEQGVKSLTLGYGQGGNLVQDLAAMHALRTQATEYFHEAGFADFHLTLVFHQWMGGFPEDEAKAFAVIALGAVVAALAKAEKIIVKTPYEAMGIPTKEANAQGLKATRQVVTMLQDQLLSTDHETMRRESGFIRAEVKCLLDAVYRAGEGDWARGAVRAFHDGLLDVPFAPSVHNRGKVLPIRDDEGFIRLFRKGGLPLSEEIQEYHRTRLEERSRTERRPVSFQMVTDDIYAISKGRLIGRPR